ncbi:MAG: Xaa-Pro peptidase family protein [Polyangiaceae bacterium]|nr:Xaa-Pro peptidase family protein [Polyangiaceae bacterium]
MLTAEGCRGRRERLWKHIQLDLGEVDAVLITEPAHVTYLSGFCLSAYEFRSVLAAAWLVLHSNGRAVLVADNLLRPYADAAFVDEIIDPVWYNGNASAGSRRELLVAGAKQALGNLGTRRVALEGASAPLSVVDKLREGGATWVDLGQALAVLRAKKDADEIAVFRRSVAAGEAGHAAALRELRPKMTEYDLYHLVRRAVEVSLGEPAQVYGDFVSGPRCEEIGGFASARVIEKGDLVLLDFSVVVQGYRCDFANTFVCDGEPKADLQEAFLACRAAMDVGEKAARAGVPCRTVDEAVRASLGERRSNFLTHSGHGLGLGHPETPFIVPASTDTLQSGNIITIEPGQYVPGAYGLRIERNYLVTEAGLEVLSKHEIRLTQI